MGFFSDITSAGKDIFGGNSKEETASNKSGNSIIVGNTTTSGTSSEQLKLDPKAIQKIISDVLGSEQGLAAILGAQNTAGIYDSTVAQEAASNFAANLVGEIAKITGETVGSSNETTTGVEQTVSQENTSSATNASNDGLLKTVLGLGKKASPNAADPVQELLLPNLQTGMDKLQEDLTPDFAKEITDRLAALEEQAKTTARDALPSAVTDFENDVNEFSSDLELQANTAVANFLGLS